MKSPVIYIYSGHIHTHNFLHRIPTVCTKTIVSWCGITKHIKLSPLERQGNCIRDTIGLLQSAFREEMVRCDPIVQ